MLFFMECMRKGYSVKMKFGRSTLEERFEMAITFDPIVGSRSNSYSRFRMLFCIEWMRNRYSMIMRSGRARLE